jgi:hypothetical protein
MGLTPRVKAEAIAGEKYPNVLFAAPPSGSEDYPAEVRCGLDCQLQLLRWLLTRLISCRYTHRLLAGAAITCCSLCVNPA